MNENTNAVVQAAPSVSQRFVDAVMREFTASTGVIELTKHQKNLIQGYFIACDNALQEAESKRAKKALENNKWGEEARNKLPYIWKNVNIDGKLARKVTAYAKLGLDMMLPNHLSAIAYLNGSNGKYDINFQEGYRGREIKAKKYSFYDIKNMVYELVYSNDHFTPHKKRLGREIESYEFEIANPFDRGNLVGGFAYVEFEDPQQNILLVMSKADIEKRKKASPSGGKGFWENWYDEMALKTVVNAVCRKVLLDPEKIDPDFRIMQQSESDAAEAELAEELRQNANREPINVTPLEPEPATIPERTQPVQQQVETPAQSEAAPDPQYVGVDMATGKDMTVQALIQDEPIGPQIPEDIKLNF